MSIENFIKYWGHLIVLMFFIILITGGILIFSLLPIPEGYEASNKNHVVHRAPCPIRRGNFPIVI